MKLKSVFILLFAIVLLTACSSSPQGINEDLYNDSVSLLSILYDVAENGDTIDIDEKTITDLTRYTVKYDETSEDWSEEDAMFITQTKAVFLPFVNYQMNGDIDQLEMFYDEIENLRKEYDIKL